MSDSENGKETSCRSKTNNKRKEHPEGTITLYVVDLRSELDKRNVTCQAEVRQNANADQIWLTGKYLGVAKATKTKTVL